MRVDQLVEGLLAQQLAVDDAGGTDLQDLVAAGRIQASGLGVEDGIDQVEQRAVVERAGLLGAAEQVEVVELGPAGGLGRSGLGRDGGLPGRDARQQEAEEGQVAGAVALEPERAAVALDHVAHREGIGLLADAHRVEFPAHDGLGADRGPDPQQVEMDAGRAAGHRLQPQLDEADRELVLQPRRQVDQGLQQAEALDAQPGGGVELGCAHRQAGLLLDAAQRGGDEVAAQHVLHRPAAGQALGGLADQGLEPLAHGLGLVAHHAQEALAHGGLEVGEVEHLERGLDAGQRGPAALGQ